MIRRRAPVFLTMALAVALLACATQPVLVVVNRSARDLALLPGIVVGACQSISVTQQQVDDAQREWSRWFSEEDEPFGWAPAGAVHWMTGIPGKRIGAPDPMVVVVSSRANPTISQGFVPGELHVCEGEPVGIE